MLTGCSSSGTSAATTRAAAPTASFAADPQVYDTLMNSCFDCHSDLGSGSWCAKLAPSYLFGAHEGRETLNFSDWGTLDAERRAAMAAKIAAVVKSGAMPPGDYGFFHPSAELSNEQKQLVLQWTAQQMASSAH
jgi:hypothetical protein